jgi:hypothetical protein
VTVKDRTATDRVLLHARLAEIRADRVGPCARKVVVELELVSGVLRNLDDAHAIAREHERRAVQLLIDERQERHDVEAPRNREPRREMSAATEDAANVSGGEHGETVVLPQARGRFGADCLVEPGNRRVDCALVAALLAQGAFETPQHVANLYRILPRLAAGALERQVA